MEKKEIAANGAKGSTPKVSDSEFERLRKRHKSELLSSKHMFLASYGAPIAIDPSSAQAKLKAKVEDEFSMLAQLPAPKSTPSAASSAAERPKIESVEEDEKTTVSDSKSLPTASGGSGSGSAGSTALVLHTGVDKTKSQALILREQEERKYVRPEWHAPWKLHKVLPGHLGWVHSLAVDPVNEWFVSASADRTIKIWDLASGTLKLTLTGHINSVTGVAVSSRSPYLFSVGLDKLVKCWDLEQNKVIRSYHGHLSGVYSVALHPTLDLLITGGRDSTARVWDIRTKAQVKCLAGHTDCVASIETQSTDPQVITGSHDKTIRLWDLITGKASSVLTHHKKSVRALVVHPKEYTFCSGAADNLKVFKCPEGMFLRNISGHNAIVNSLAVNRDNVLVSAGDNGSVCLWDWNTGYNFQTLQTIAQPGSLDAESGVFTCVFDKTGSRLLTGEADKSIKIWREDETASVESHPINFKPKKRKRF